MAKHYSKTEKITSVIISLKRVNPLSFEELLDNAKKEFNVDLYKFNTEQGEVVIISNLREALQESIKAETNFMPSAISNKFTKFVVTNDTLPDSYILSKLLMDKNVALPDDDRLMPESDAEDLTSNLYKDFTDINMIDCRAAQQAVVEAVDSLMLKTDPRLMSLGLFEFVKRIGLKTNPF